MSLPAGELCHAQCPIPDTGTVGNMELARFGKLALVKVEFLAMSSIFTDFARKYSYAKLNNEMNTIYKLINVCRKIGRANICIKVQVAKTRKVPTAKIKIFLFAKSVGFPQTLQISSEHFYNYSTNIYDIHCRFVVCVVFLNIAAFQF